MQQQLPSSQKAPLLNIDRPDGRWGLFGLFSGICIALVLNGMQMMDICRVIIGWIQIGLGIAFGIAAIWFVFYSYRRQERRKVNHERPEDEEQRRWNKLMESIEHIEHGIERDRIIWRGVSRRRR